MDSLITDFMRLSTPGDNSHTRHMVVIASVQYSEALLLIRSDPNLLFSVVAI